MPLFSQSANQFSAINNRLVFGTNDDEISYTKTANMTRKTLKD